MKWYRQNFKIKTIKPTYSCRSASNKLVITGKLFSRSKHTIVTYLKFVTKIYRSLMS